MAKKSTEPKVKVMRDTKTNHQTGYHKPVRNKPTNYKMSSHKAFCKRCLAGNGVCTRTGTAWPDENCEL